METKHGHVYTADGRRLYTQQQLAELLGVPHSTITTWRSRGQLPDPDVWVDRRTPLWTAETVARNAPTHLISNHAPGSADRA